MMTDWLQNIDESVVALLIPIVAIVMGVGYAIVKAVLRHRERLEMIRHGMHPDSPPFGDEEKT